MLRLGHVSYELIGIYKKDQWFERRKVPRCRVKEGQVSTRSRSSHVALMADIGKPIPGMSKFLAGPCFGTSLKSQLYYINCFICDARMDSSIAFFKWLR